MLYTSQKTLKSKTCINQRKDFSSKSNSILIKVIFDLNWLLALLRMPRISLKLYSSLLWWCWMRKLLFSKHHEQKSFRQSNVVPGITYHQNVTFHFEKCLFWLFFYFKDPSYQFLQKCKDCPSIKVLFTDEKNFTKDWIESKSLHPSHPL